MINGNHVMPYSLVAAAEFVLLIGGPLWAPAWGSRITDSLCCDYTIRCCHSIAASPDNSLSIAAAENSLLTLQLLPMRSGGLLRPHGGGCSPLPTAGLPA